MKAYRTEHPNPQFQRNSFESLNGTWSFAYGKADGRLNCALSQAIQVPFCPESTLSGVHNTDFIPDCVYSREIDVIEADLCGRLVLHFGAVDYATEVFVNGVKAGEHTGGYTAFEVEITPFVAAGKNRITVAVHDDVRENVPSGKQSGRRASFGCFYTRVTGIWQSVWLERTPKAYIRGLKLYPDAAHGKVRVELTTEGNAHTEILVTYKGKETGRAAGDGYFRHGYEIALTETHLWEVGHGRLYDVVVRFGDDEVHSYFGLRDVQYDGKKFLLNGKSVFQRLVLDQGYYPEGLYTAPDATDFRKDIEQVKAFGFNGIRLHQKVFEQRYLHACDTEGVLVWGEYASWGVRYDTLEALGTFTAEWTEAVTQYFNHPSIVTWCPLNEVWSNLDDTGKVRDVRFVESAYWLTKTLDPTRPCVDVSGGYHGRFTDIFDFHCYHSPEEITNYIRAVEQDDALIMDTLYPPVPEPGTVYDGRKPLHASEYGGIAYRSDGHANGLTVKTPCVTKQEPWGYTACDSEEAFTEQYVRATEQLLRCDKISGFCYTQLYDIEQEQNGLMRYDRTAKLSVAAVRRIAECNRAHAAIENEE